jgi:hypothetical protein
VVRDESLAKDMYDELRAYPLFDTHEHTLTRDYRRSVNFCLFDWFIHYSGSDLVSAGMPASALQAILSPSELTYEERWVQISPYWSICRHTEYGRTLELAARELYGVDRIDDETWRHVNEGVLSSNHTPLYEQVLSRAGIKRCVVDPLREGTESSERFSYVRRWDRYIELATRSPITDLEHDLDVGIMSLEEYCSALDSSIAQAVTEGVVGIKIGLAYSRTLRFEHTDFKQANRVFDQLMAEGFEFAPRPADTKALQDHLLHHVVQRAIEVHWPIQVHTGIQEGIGNVVRNSDPTNLTNLLNAYPQARWDLFHGGYPWTSHMAVLGKTFPSVHVDLCWLWVISQEMTERVLSEWIDIVPANKILGFGGDYMLIEGTLAHAQVAREGIARVLASKVRDGRLTRSSALEIGRWILHDNAATLFDFG